MTSARESLYPAEVETRWQQADWELIQAVPEAPPMNLALDEVLTRSVGRGDRRPTLRFWGWSAPCVVLGRFQSVRNEVQIENAREQGIQIVRRISGGGAMFIEPPLAITYSIHVPPSGMGIALYSSCRPLSSRLRKSS